MFIRRSIDIYERKKVLVFLITRNSNDSEIKNWLVLIDAAAAMDHTC